MSIIETANLCHLFNGYSCFAWGNGGGEVVCVECEFGSGRDWVGYNVGITTHVSPSGGFTVARLVHLS